MLWFPISIGGKSVISNEKSQYTILFGMNLITTYLSKWVKRDSPISPAEVSNYSALLHLYKMDVH